MNKWHQIAKVETKSATNPLEKRDPPPKDSGQIYIQNALKTWTNV
jgi:hypothetical protein